MTCNVKGCSNPDIKTYTCSIEMDSGKTEVHDVRCCSEHEKAFEALYGKKDRFYN